MGETRRGKGKRHKDREARNCSHSVSLLVVTVVTTHVKKKKRTLLPHCCCYD